MSTMDAIKGHVQNNKGKYGLATGAALAAGAMTKGKDAYNKLKDSEVGQNVVSTAKSLGTVAREQGGAALDAIKSGAGKVTGYLAKKAGDLTVSK